MELGIEGEERGETELGRGGREMEIGGVRAGDMQVWKEGGMGLGIGEERDEMG